MVESGKLSSLILWGPAGTGKTTLARLLAVTAGFEMETLSAVSSGVKDLREVIARASERLGERGRRTVLFIDEIHRFNKAQQDLLLPATETGQIVLIGATTENPYFEVNSALISRTTQWRLLPLDEESLELLVRRALGVREATADDDAIDRVVHQADGDGRAALTTLDVALAFALHRDSGEIRLSLQDVVAARDGRIFHQSADTHYDQVSAFIKSIRGSDPDAAVFWMTALLNAGESARFIARRLIILASEDIGLADLRALPLAESAARAVEFVGLPEARLNLAHATIALSLMAKSNSVTIALGRAASSLDNGASTEVPSDVRDASYSAATTLGHGTNYQYPHDFASGWVDQQYVATSIPGRPFYEPRDHGDEVRLSNEWTERTNAPTQAKTDPPVE